VDDAINEAYGRPEAKQPKMPPMREPIPVSAKGIPAEGGNRAAAVPYIIPVLGSLAALVFSKSEASRFHAHQAILLYICEAVFLSIVWLLPALFYPPVYLLFILPWVLTPLVGLGDVLLFYWTLKGRPVRLPILGKKAREMA
jgi:uncharacterized membrane protein